MSKDLLELHPKVRERFKSFLEELRKRTGQDILFSWTYRNKDQQAEMLKKGTSSVDYAMSWHNNEDENGNPASLAADIFNNIPGKLYDIDWKIVKKVCQEFGLEWGGDWKSFPDKPHVQYTEGHTRWDIINSPTIVNNFKQFNKPTMPKDHAVSKDHSKEILDVLYKWDFHIQQEEGDCVPFSIMSAAMITAQVKRPELKLKPDYTFDERVRELCGFAKDSVNGLDPLFVKQKLKETHTVLDMDCGEAVLSIDAKSIRQLTRDIKIYKRYLKLGIPLIISMSISSMDYTTRLIKYTDKPIKVPVKHNATLVGIDEGLKLGLWYDNKYPKNYNGSPKGVNAMEIKFLEQKGNRSTDGISNPCAILPKITITK